MTAQPASQTGITAKQVRDFLKQHPEFISNNSDVMQLLVPPARDLGGDIADFQHYLVKNLQKDSQALKSRYDLLVDFCRDNLAIQERVHRATLRLIHTNSLEQLLEVLTLDLVSLFDVDVVRMAMESETPFDTSYGDQNYSGIIFVAPGMVNAALGLKKNVLLLEDCAIAACPGFEQIFADCDTMIASCALLRLQAEAVGKQVLLAFGVRHKNRFHPGQSVELLSFLAQVVAHQMDRYLQELVL